MVNLPSGWAYPCARASRMSATLLIAIAMVALVAVFAAAPAAHAQLGPILQQQTIASAPADFCTIPPQRDVGEDVPPAPKVPLRADGSCPPGYQLYFGQGYPWG